MLKKFIHSLKDLNVKVTPQPEVNEDQDLPDSCSTSSNDTISQEDFPVAKPIEIKYYVPKSDSLGLSQSLVCYTDPVYQQLAYDYEDVSSEYEDEDVIFPTFNKRKEDLYSKSVPTDFYLDQLDQNFSEKKFYSDHEVESDFASDTLAISSDEETPNGEVLEETIDVNNDSAVKEVSTTDEENHIEYLVEQKFQLCEEDGPIEYLVEQKVYRGDEQLAPHKPPYIQDNDASDQESYIQIKSRNDEPTDSAYEEEEEDECYEEYREEEEQPCCQEPCPPIIDHYGVENRNGTFYYYGPLLVEPIIAYTFVAPPMVAYRTALSPPSVPTIPEEDEDFAEWTDLADSTYDEPSTTLWNAMHTTERSVELLKKNPFIHLLLKREVRPLKISQLPKATQYKEIQNHFFNPNVVYIRHLRHFRCAYIVYRSHQEMMNAYHDHRYTLINKKPILIELSTMADLERDYALDEARRLRCTKSIVNKKYDTFIPNYHQIDQNKIDAFTYYHQRAQLEKLTPVSKYNIPQSETHYVLVKPKDIEELYYIEQYGYLPIEPDKVEYLNEVFHASHETILFLSKKQSRRFQGYVKMKSEVLDMDDISYTTGLSFRKKTGWKHACKVEWVANVKPLAMKAVGDLCSHGKLVRYSHNITLLEGKVGEKIKAKMD